MYVTHDASTGAVSALSDDNGVSDSTHAVFPVNRKSFWSTANLFVTGTPPNRLLRIDSVNGEILARERGAAAGTPPVVAPRAGADEGVAVTAYGHSYLASDAGNAIPGTRYINRLNRRRGWSSLLNRAVGGSFMADAAILAMGVTASKWTPAAPPTNAGIMFIQCLANDVIQQGASVKALAGSTNAFRSLCTLAKASSRIESSTFALTGTWTTGTDVRYSGNSLIRSTVLGSTATATWTGTDVALVLWGIDGAAATAEIRVDGVLVKSIDLSDQMVTTIQTNAVVPICIPLTGMSNTSHTIEVRHAGPGGNFIFVDALLPLNTVSPTQVVVVKDPFINPGGGYPNYSDAAMSRHHTMIDNVAAEFSNQVLVVPPPPDWDKATMLGPDGVHPNAYGMDVMAYNIGHSLDTLGFRPGLVT